METTVAVAEVTRGVKNTRTTVTIDREFEDGTREKDVLEFRSVVIFGENLDSPRGEEEFKSYSAGPTYSVVNILGAIPEMRCQLIKELTEKVEQLEKDAKTV
jgi:hypothetical protein